MHFQDDEPLTIHAEEDLPVETQTSGVGSALDEVVLFAAGLGASALAIALAFAPRYSHAMQRVSEKLASMGFSNGTMLAAGVVLCGLAMVMRRRGEKITVSVPARTGSIDLVADELPGQVEALSLHIASLESRIAESLEQSAAQVGEPKDTAAERDELIEAIAKRQNGALFRLAASLDQLGARLEKHVDSRFDEVTTHLSSVNQQPTYPQEPSYEQGTMQASDVQGAIAELPQDAPAGTPPSGQTSLGVLDTLDESGAQTKIQPIAHVAQVQADQAPETQSAPPAQAVDAQAMAPNTAAPQTAPQTAPHQPAAPVPGQAPHADAPTAPFAEDHNPHPNQAGIDGSAEDLESLLPDYRVRDAINDDRVPR